MTEFQKATTKAELQKLFNTMRPKRVGHFVLPLWFGAFYDCTFTHCKFDRAFIHEEPALHPDFLKGCEFYTATDTIPRHIREAGIPAEIIYDGESNFITVSNCQFAN